MLSPSHTLFWQHFKNFTSSKPSHQIVKKDLKIPWTEKLHNMLKDLRICQVLVAHACNPSYSGSRGKKKSVGRVIQGVSPEFKPQYQKKKKKKNLTCNAK
jgi:hypothetical protein